MWVLARTAALSDSGLIARQNATTGVCVYFSRPVNTIMSLLRSLDRPHACRALGTPKTFRLGFPHHPPMV